MDKKYLACATLDELERIYRDTSAPLAVPRGRFLGQHLAWLRTTGNPVWLGPALWLAFSRIPFGVDFDDRRWFFLHHAARVGHFLPDIGPSRWRDTQAIRLHYHPSRLPGTVRTLLYDEVKPLTEPLCLGIGGIHAPRGRGEQFFFALERIG